MILDIHQHTGDYTTAESNVSQGHIEKKQVHGVVQV
jgi:hypothetical protein